jgi:hypothetical protein
MLETCLCPSSIAFSSIIGKPRGSHDALPEVPAISLCRSSTARRAMLLVEATSASMPSRSAPAETSSETPVKTHCLSFRAFSSTASCEGTLSEAGAGSHTGDMPKTGPVLRKKRGRRGSMVG